MFEYDSLMTILKAIDKYWNILDEETEWIFSRKLFHRAMRFIIKKMNPFLYIKEEMQQEIEEKHFQNQLSLENEEVFYMVFEEDRKVMDQKNLEEFGLKPRKLSYNNKLDIYIGEYLLHNRELYRHQYDILHNKTRDKWFKDKLTEWEKYLAEGNFERHPKTTVLKRIDDLKRFIVDNKQYLKQSEEMLESTKGYVQDWREKLISVLDLIKKGIIIKIGKRKEVK